MPKSTIHTAEYLINPDFPPIAGGAILVRDGRVAATGTATELKNRYPTAAIELHDGVILPGFINAHTHLELTHFPAWLHTSAVDYHPRRFTDWIIQVIKITRRLSPDDYPPSIEEGVRMCLESGTTAIGEVVTHPAMADQYYRSPLAGRLYFELLGQDAGLFRSKLAAATAAAMRTEAGIFNHGLSPHSLYTIAEQHLATIREQTVSHALPLAIHLSESRSESDLMFEGGGDFATSLYPFVGWDQFLGRPPRCSSTELLQRNGLLTPGTLAVHCVHVSLGDARIIKASGAHIALCPRSNDLLDVGRAPVTLFKKLGIPLALGTDSLASNNSLSLWDELRFALDAFPHDLSECDVFRMVTSGGAAALGLSGDCGSLEVGKRADFQVVGNCEGAGERLLQRVMREGLVQEVFVNGVRYVGTCSGHSL